jgi:hypothetical protein
MPLLRRCLLANFVLMSLILSAPAASASSPERVGAFAGAMRYCQERLPGPDTRYRRARLRAARELEEMSRRERSRAFSARDRAFQNGHFLGERLNRRSCDRLVRASEWSRFDRD